MATDAASTTSTVLNLLTTRGSSDYIGEPISQIEHSLQAAHLATINGAASDTIIAALLHDIGQFLPASDVQRLAGEVKDMRSASLSNGSKSANVTAPDSGSVGRVGHELVGKLYLQEMGFSPKVCELVGSHVAAKRYLCAVDPAYHDTLSDASKQSLKFQGGPMTGDELKTWGDMDWCQEMCQLRKWDDGAKLVGLEVRGVGAYEEMIQNHLERQATLACL